MSVAGFSQIGSPSLDFPNLSPEDGWDAKKLWKTYIGLTQVEDSFRITKHDLGLRPIFHQKTERTQAHILVCFLALVLWRTLQHWMQSCGLGTAPRKLLQEMAEVSGAKWRIFRANLSAR